jgi:ketosteroid isomerase-like protein
LARRYRLTFGIYGCTSAKFYAFENKLILGFLTVVCLMACGLYADAQARGKAEKERKKSMETDAAIMSSPDVEKLIIDLDTQYQRAVKINDAATMDRILADDFILVTGKGSVYTKADLLKDAREGKTVYEHQEDLHQTVRIWGDTAVITALLWEKGVSNGKTFDKKLWFSDTYVRTPQGWHYVFGQASIPLPDDH